MYPVMRPPLTQPPEGVRGLKFPDILEASFVSLIVGKPGTGKTHLIEQLLTDPQFYCKRFNHVLFCVPSGFGQFALTEQNHCPQLTTAWLMERLRDIQERHAESQVPFNVLIVMDDVVSQLKKLENDRLMQELFNNRRHVFPHGTISIILTTQKFSIVPTVFRATVTNLFLFEVTPKERDIVMKEMI